MNDSLIRKLTVCSAARDAKMRVTDATGEGPERAGARRQEERVGVPKR